MTLPLGWAEATISEIASVRTIKAQPSSLGGQPFIGLEHVEPYVAKLLGHGTARDVKSAVILYNKGDVLFGRLRPYLNKVIETPFDGCASAEFVPFAPEAGVNASFVRHIMMSPRFLAFTASLDRGDRPRVSSSEVGRFSLMLPPSTEQDRIVAKLSAFASWIAQARVELDRGAALTKRLRNRILASAYAVTRNVAGVEPISFFISSLDQGWSPKCENYPSKSAQEWAVLKTTAVQALRFQDYENKMLPVTMQPRERLEVTAGDVLVTRAGPRVRVGISCAVAETRPRLIIADKIYRLRCNPSFSVPDYLAFMLNSPQLLERIEAMKTGISDSGLNLTQEKFLSLPIPKLPVDQQEEVVGKLSAQLARADQLRAEADRARALLDRLEAAILAKALHGELVPQDPSDEPAHVLLERIRARRAAAPKARRGRWARATADA